MPPKNLFFARPASPMLRLSQMRSFGLRAHTRVSSSSSAPSIRNNSRRGELKLGSLLLLATQSLGDDMREWDRLEGRKAIALCLTLMDLCAGRLRSARLSASARAS